MPTYLNTEILNTLTRPHDAPSSIASIASGFNYLFQQQFSPELLYKIVGKVIKHPTHEIFLMWSEIIAAYFEKQICGQVYFKGGWKQGEEPDKAHWNTIQRLIRTPNSYLILHTTGHYIPIIGFASYPYHTQSTEKNENRWLFLAETCPWHHLGAVPELHLSLSPPIICIRWEAVRKMLNGAICLSRHRS
ncbi:MAG: hypothetical protein CV087_21685 [Candidatus Brocadia sp. WS118]|nr:MAG: hypothetical protein CV087_21685 [Candidatus Brocadia sp. WS118]